MTKEQVKAEVLAKIAGQGSMIDQGGALATILDAIVDLIPEGGGPEKFEFPVVYDGSAAWDLGAGVTTADIVAAYEAGKSLIAVYDSPVVGSDIKVYAPILSYEHDGVGDTILTFVDDNMDTIARLQLMP